MRKKFRDYTYNMICCMDGRFIAVQLFYLLFIILHYEKNYLLMCNYYGMEADNINDFILYIFSDGFFLILFLPIVILTSAWKIVRFFYCDSLKLLKCKRKSLIIKKYYKYIFEIATGVVIYLIFIISLIGKIAGMKFTLDIEFIPNILFTYLYILFLMLIYLFSVAVFSCNEMGIIGASVPLIFELLVWKNQVKKLFGFALFYNIVTSDVVEITYIQKFIFWLICIALVTVILKIIVCKVDLGTNRSIKEVVTYIFEKYSIGIYSIGIALWSVFYAALTYCTSKDFFSTEEEFILICFRGFSGYNVQDMIFYLILCLPLWVYLINYFKKFFDTFAVYIFMKTGGLIKCMFKCISKLIKDTIIYFSIMFVLTWLMGNLVFQGNGKNDIYGYLVELSGGVIGLVVDYILLTIELMLFIMILYLLFYRADVAFVLGIGCHILCVVAASITNYKKIKIIIPLTQNILLIRDEEYNIVLSRFLLCLTIIVVYVFFCGIIRIKQEKILTGSYK